MGGGLIVIIPQDRTLYRGQTPRHQVLYLTVSECQKLNKEAACVYKYENIRIELEFSGKPFQTQAPWKRGMYNRVVANVFNGRWPRLYNQECIIVYLRMYINRVV